MPRREWRPVSRSAAKQLPQERRQQLEFRLLNGDLVPVDVASACSVEDIRRRVGMVLDLHPKRICLVGPAGASLVDAEPVRHFEGVCNVYILPDPLEGECDPYSCYDPLIRKYLGSGPAAFELKCALHDAYGVSILFEGSYKFAATVQEVHQILDELSEFSSYQANEVSKIANKRSRIRSAVWQQELHGKSLHGVLLKRIKACERMGEIRGWMNIAKEMTHLMVLEKASDLGYDEAIDKEDYDLHELQQHLNELVAKATTANDCLRLLRLEFGCRPFELLCWDAA